MVPAGGTPRMPGGVHPGADNRTRTNPYIPGKVSVVTLVGLGRLLRDPVDTGGLELDALAFTRKVDLDSDRPPVLDLDSPAVLRGCVHQRDRRSLAGDGDCSSGHTPGLDHRDRWGRRGDGGRGPGRARGCPRGR